MAFFLRIEQILQQVRHLVVVPERDPNQCLSSARQVGQF